MSSMPRRALATLAVAVCAVAPLRADGGWASLLDRYAPAVVNLRVTLRTEMEGSGAPPQEATDEVRGALVGPQGLILVWNSDFSAGRTGELFSQLSGDDSRHIKVTPTEIRVTLPGDTKERAAFLAASDSDLDLAFVQLEDPPAEPLPFVDFSQSAPVAIGDEVATVSRLSSAFDRAPFFDVVRVTGQVRKPRAAWIVAGGNATQVGLPYFTADGRPAGVLVTFVSKAGDATSQNPSKLFAQLMSLGRGDSEVGPIGLFLLPADRVRAVVELAAQRATELQAEHAPKTQE